MPDSFLHDHGHFKQLIEITAIAQKIDNPTLVEKDYWIMHSLYSLQQLGITYELKGGTSLSKGYGIIDRFSEDIDIRIEPDETRIVHQVFFGKNHDKPRHRESRKRFFDWLANYFEGNIPGIVDVARDPTFDDSEKFRNGGIRLFYQTNYALPEGLKEGILLEVGFDRTNPNEKKDISSWAFEHAKKVSEFSFIDNRAIAVPCYAPHFTFVEKLQTIVRKYRLLHEQRGKNNLPPNFIRHYYDLYQLIDLPIVQDFIGTSEYEAYKKERFKGDDTIVCHSNALHLSDPKERAAFKKEYERTEALYYRARPSFEGIIQRLQLDLSRL